MPAIHTKRNKKIEMAGLLRVTVFIYLIHEGSEVDVILTEPQRCRNCCYLLTREEEKAFTTEVNNFVVSEGRTGPYRANFIHPESCQNLISVNLVQYLFQASVE